MFSFFYPEMHHWVSTKIEIFHVLLFNGSKTTNRRKMKLVMKLTINRQIFTCYGLMYNFVFLKIQTTSIWLIIVKLFFLLFIIKFMVEDSHCEFILKLNAFSGEVISYTWNNIEFVVQRWKCSWWDMFSIHFCLQ